MENSRQAGPYESLRETAESHRAVTHPFLRRFAEGPLTPAQIKSFGLQHYQLVKTFPRYLRALRRRLRTGPVYDLISIILRDEYGGADPGADHPHLYKRFLRAAGVPFKHWDYNNWIPEVYAFVEAHLAMTRRAPIEIGLGAMGPGHEWILPAMFRPVLSGLRASGLFQEADLAYFTLHIEQDVEHGRLLSSAIGAFATGPAARMEVLNGAEQSMDLRARLWDGLDREIFDIPSTPPVQ